MHYLRNKDLLAEVISCKERGDVSRELLQMWCLIIKGVHSKLSYTLYADRQDCMAGSMEDMLRYWKGFDESKSTNAFAYFTQIAKNGSAKAFKRLHHPLDPGTVYFSQLERTDGNNNTASTIMELPF